MLKNYFILLQPMRTCVLGPPASGKSIVVRQLCEHFKLHHIKIQDVIKEAIDDLVINSFVSLLLIVLQGDSTLKHQRCGVFNSFAYSESLCNPIKSSHGSPCTLSFLQPVG